MARRIAQLVKSERVDGQPRQRVVAYFGTLDEADTMTVGARWGFWRDVGRRILKLEAAGVLNQATRSKVERALVAVVPFPTREELEADNRARQEAWDRLNASADRIMSHMAPVVPIEPST